MLTKTQKMLATRAETMARRAGQDLRVRELKLVEASLSASQKEKLQRTFLEAKWLRNSIVAKGVFTWTPKDGVLVKEKDGTFTERKLTTLHSQSRQKLQAALQANVKSLATAKSRGRLVGSLGFVSEVNSVEWPTGAVRVQGNHAQLPLIGRVRVLGSKQLGEEIANVRLVRKPSGYYLLVSSLTSKKPLTFTKGPVGLDFGIRTHITTSQGETWNATVEEPERLRRLQRKLNRQVKGSNNHWKTRKQLQREYEKISNKRDELASQLVASLKGHSLVAFQDENLRAWKTRYGKTMHHSAMGRVKAKLRLLPQAVMVERFAPTTQLCPSCGALNKIPLSQRIYSCACGYSQQRDSHAANNMLLFAKLSPGEPGVAPVERKTTGARKSPKPTSVKQETAKLRTHRGKGGEAAPETVKALVSP